MLLIAPPGPPPPFAKGVLARTRERRTDAGRRIWERNFPAGGCRVYSDFIVVYFTAVAIQYASKHIEVACLYFLFCGRLADLRSDEFLIDDTKALI